MGAPVFPFLLAITTRNKEFELSSAPVRLRSKDGREVTAKTPREVNDLLARGYNVVKSKPAPHNFSRVLPEPEETPAPVEPGNVPEIDELEDTIQFTVNWDEL